MNYNKLKNIKSYMRYQKKLEQLILALNLILSFLVSCAAQNEPSSDNCHCHKQGSLLATAAAAATKIRYQIRHSCLISIDRRLSRNDYARQSQNVARFILSFISKPSFVINAKQLHRIVHIVVSLQITENIFEEEK